MKCSILLPYRKNYYSGTQGRLTGIFNKNWLLVFLLFFAFSGCKKVVEEVGTIGICPTIVSTDPAPGAINVLTTKIITATFNEPMDPATINTGTFQLKQGNNFVLGTVTYSGIAATFTPSGPLSANTVYTATITKGVRDPAKNAMIADFVWNFNTGSTPMVVSTDPANGATDVPLKKLIRATFSTNMDPSSINATTFIVKMGSVVIPGAVSYAGLVATFTPAAPLTVNSVYSATISNGAKDVAGNAMSANYNWSFATGALPIVVSTDPENGATNVLINKVISATFSKQMNSATINKVTFTLQQGNTAIPGTVTYSGKKAFFTPDNILTNNTLYTATIFTGVTDSSGNNMAANYVWSFTTGNAPVVISTDPANGEQNVALSKIISASFSTAMDPTTINATSFLVKQGSTAVAGTVTYAGTTAKFAPSSPLITNKSYTATITTAVKDALGNNMVAKYVWTFQTGTAPLVTSTDPADNEQNVSLSKIISANFNTAMDPTTINTTSFQIKQGSTPVTGTVSYSGTTAKFTPTAPLSNNLTYTATITTAAKDVLGNPMAADYVWDFSTLKPPPPPSILGSAANFGAFGGSAGVTNQGLNTIINNGGIGTTAASTLITGFHDGKTGDVYTETPLNVGNSTGGIFTAPPAPGTAASAKIANDGLADANIAYLAISPASKPGGTDPGAGELGGLTLAPGIYKSASGTFKITNGDLVLDAKGDANAVWIFQTASGLTVGSAGPAGARTVTMINGGLPKNVYWYVGSAATINAAGGGTMVGTIIASAGVTFSTAGVAVQTVLNGRALSLVASVTMVNTTINNQ